MTGILTLEQDETYTLRSLFYRFIEYYQHIVYSVRCPYSFKELLKTNSHYSTFPQIQTNPAYLGFASHVWTWCTVNKYALVKGKKNIPPRC